MRARNSKKQFIRLLMFIAVIVLVITGVVIWKRQPDSASTEANQQKLAQEVARLAIVPPGETPQITTVIDKSKVNQAFLQNAENGDAVLLYFQAGRAVVYRPSAHKIVNMGPLVQPTPSVFLRNGSAGNIPESLATTITQGDQFTVASQDKAIKQDYKQTMVIDLTGTRPDVATKLARVLKATVAQLPAGESRPDADMLVIVGSDLK